MDEDTDIQYEDASPDPEYLITSLSEQGYSLESAVADLVDNSISAGADRVEILVDTESTPFRVFIADNGRGMSEAVLKAAVRFPSGSSQKRRDVTDLGRFGLGLKTASFSQTRQFTVISRENGAAQHVGRTWDTEILRTKKWKVVVNQREKVEELLAQYSKLSSQFLSHDEGFNCSTLVVWHGLYKYEHYIKERNKQEALSRDLTEIVGPHLALVFHRFLESSAHSLSIRLNNSILEPFNPFPQDAVGIRALEVKQRLFGDSSVRFEGFVLPSRSLEEVRSGPSKWVPKGRSLLDMEGVYVYRADRIILYGGWLGMVQKSQKMRLARMRVEFGNGADHRLHLNVAKSQVVIPHDLRSAFISYVEELRSKAALELYNRGVAKIRGQSSRNKAQLFRKVYTNHGAVIEIDPNFPIVEALLNSLSGEAKGQFRVIMKSVETLLNKLRSSHAEQVFSGEPQVDGIAEAELANSIRTLLDAGYEKSFVRIEVLPQLGFEYDTLPANLREMIE
jgi:hypothetical protein